MQTTQITYKQWLFQSKFVDIILLIRPGKRLTFQSVHHTRHCVYGMKRKLLKPAEKFLTHLNLFLHVDTQVTLSGFLRRHPA